MNFFCKVSMTNFYISVFSSLISLGLQKWAPTKLLPSWLLFWMICSEGLTSYAKKVVAKKFRLLETAIIACQVASMIFTESDNLSYPNTISPCTTITFIHFYQRLSWTSSKSCKKLRWNGIRDDNSNPTVWWGPKRIC